MLRAAPQGTGLGPTGRSTGGVEWQRCRYSRRGAEQARQRSSDPATVRQRACLDAVQIKPGDHAMSPIRGAVSALL
jgi:hypothetical protein